jgi:NADPH-dependent 2,4-dienoyl-CoA reductase/sulfur reductase-like enzyme
MNQHVDYLIIGGGIAGVTAAESIRTRDAKGSIRILGQEKHALYSRVLLPHVVRGQVPEQNAFLRKPNALSDMHIEYVTGARVHSVDPGRHTAILADGTEQSYGKLLIATGGTSRRLDCPGAKEANAIYLQTLEDARELRAASGTARALVYGGGFSALELLMSFGHHGAPVAAVVRGDGFFGRVLDPESRAMIHAALKKHGIDILTRTEIRGIEVKGGLKAVHLSDGSVQTCTALGVGIGIVPNIGFLAGSGIATNVGVLADDHLRASQQDVFVAGDVAEFDDRALGMRHVVGNWQNAMFHGKTAGLNMAGDDVAYEAVSSYSIPVYDLPLTFAGSTTAADAERIVRHTEKGAVLQLFLVSGKVVGATCVGPYSDRVAINALMSSKTPLSAQALTALSEGKTPLSSIVG